MGKKVVMILVLIFIYSLSLLDFLHSPLPPSQQVFFSMDYGALLELKKITSSEGEIRRFLLLLGFILFCIYPLYLSSIDIKSNMKISLLKGYSVKQFIGVRFIMFAFVPYIFLLFTLLLMFAPFIISAVFYSEWIWFDFSIANLFMILQMPLSFSVYFCLLYFAYCFIKNAPILIIFIVVYAFFSCIIVEWYYVVELHPNLILNLRTTLELIIMLVLEISYSFPKSLILHVYELAYRLNAPYMFVLISGIAFQFLKVYIFYLLLCWKFKKRDLVDVLA